MSSSALTLTQKFSWPEMMLMSVLNKLPLGSLQLEMPNGQVVHFGRGNEVKATLRVSDKAFFMKCVLYGDIGFAESYLDGDWDTDSLSNVISWFIINLDHNPVLSGRGIRRYALNFLRIVNGLRHKKRRNTLQGARRNIVEHYDLGNDFYQLFLDKTMTYSGAIFSGDNMSLEQAQSEKYDRICRKLALKPEDHVLEIGSGWGGFAVHAAKNYGCRVMTITISEEQFKYARARIAREGLSDRIEILLQDYRTMEGSFDKIVSIEMLEAVGHEYLPVYFRKCHQLLKPHGSMALQVITSRDRRYAEFRNDVDFIQKHIFPGSQTPSLAAIQEAILQSTNFNLFDVKDIGLDYAETLRQWFQSFNQHLDEVRKLGMDDYFIRKWNYYLQYCEAAFQQQHITLMQLIYIRPGSKVG